MYTNARFQSNGKSDFWTKFAQNYVNDKIFEKRNIKIVKKHIVMYPCIKF